MSDHRLIAEAQAKALIDEINAKTQTQSDDMLDDAQAEAATIMKTAYRDARARLHSVVRRLRKYRETSLSREKARLALERSLRQQKEDAQLLVRGLPLIENAMRRRWGDNSARQIWIVEALKVASTFLPEGDWQIYMSPEIQPDQFRRICSKIDIAAGVNLNLISDPATRAGLRIEMDDAVVDASLEGLLADSETIKAMLLAQTDLNRSIDGHFEPALSGGSL